MHDASAPPRARSMLAAAVLLGIAVRVALLLAAGDWLGARHAALDTLDLSLFYDGRLYLLVARSFPLPYQDAGSDPIPVDYPNLTIYFPLLPAAIWGVAGAVRDLNHAGLVAPILAGALSILLFDAHRAAARLAAAARDVPVRGVSRRVAADHDAALQRGADAAGRARGRRGVRRRATRAGGALRRAGGDRAEERLSRDRHPAAGAAARARSPGSAAHGALRARGAAGAGDAGLPRRRLRRSAA